MNLIKKIIPSKIPFSRYPFVQHRQSFSVVQRIYTLTFSSCRSHLPIGTTVLKNTPKCSHLRIIKVRKTNSLSRNLPFSLSRKEVLNYIKARGSILIASQAIKGVCTFIVDRIIGVSVVVFVFEFF